MTIDQGVRLVSFLGTGGYTATRYQWAGAEPEGILTSYTAFALARMLPASDVWIACTRAAEDAHAARLREEFARAGLAAPHFKTLRDGKTRDELWENFSIVKELAGQAGGRGVVLDITHGFRSQPFFAGAIVSFLRAIGKSDAETKVVYAAFDAGGGECTPVWDLTPFVDLIDWGHAIRQFLRTGDSRPVAERAERLGRSVSKTWALGGMRGSAPRLREFAKAMNEFGEALLTVRIGELLLSSAQRPSAARRLAEAGAALREEIAQHAPPIAQVLPEIEELAKSLVLEQDHLAGEEGRRVMAALAAEFESAMAPAPAVASAGATWFVSRHPGALEWARRQGLAVDRTVRHLEIQEVKAGDTVIGTLPVNLAAQVCAHGARYLNLSLDLPEEARGRELTADELERFGAKLEPFVVERKS